MTAPVTSESAPNWDQISIELHCPRCGYDVRRLPTPRCPECGLVFRWHDLLLAAQRQSQSPLWEEQWRWRPVRAFLATVALSMLAPLIWRNVRMEMQPRRGALLLFAAAALALYGLLTYCVAQCYRAYLLFRSGSAGAMGRPFSWDLLWLPWDEGFIELGALAGLALALLCATVLFWQTLWRRRVRFGHVLRIVVYSWTALLAWRSVWDIALTSTSAAVRHWSGRLWFAEWPWLTAEAVQWTVLLLAYCGGMSLYLRWSWGWLHGLIGFFGMITIMLLLNAVLTVLVFEALDNPFSAAVHELAPRAITRVYVYLATLVEVPSPKVPGFAVEPPGLMP